MLPLLVALLGTGIKSGTSLFLGWFGPRGLASVSFALLILERTDVAHKEVIFTAIIVTVVSSIVLHGLTAGPMARVCAASTKVMGESEENRPVLEEPFTDTLKSARTSQGQWTGSARSDS